VKALILNIQRYSLHDGAGIRTIVFFKGCPLKCPWCSNPESIGFEAEKVKMESKCIHCKHCSFDVEECPSGAITEFGKYMTVEEVVAEVQKDIVFYRTSKGGVTLSGGEVLAQSTFALELLKALKNLGIDTVIETSGQGSTENLIKSIINIMSLGLKKGEEIKIIAEGTDEKEVMEALISLVENKFGEA